MELISGKDLSLEIKENIKNLNLEKGLSPCLAAIDVGGNEENLRYIRLKEKSVQEIGGTTKVVSLPAEISREELLDKINELNLDAAVHGILLQLPLPGALADCQEEFLEAILPEKDVDGFHPTNIGKLMSTPAFVSCAAIACMEVSKRYAAPLKNKSVVLVGDSFDVIQPLALLYLKEGARVTILPVYEPSCLLNADLAVIEKGGPLVVKGNDVKPGALLIDAGFFWHNDRLCGNVDKDSCTEATGSLLPVPGGMGPLLIAELMVNLSQAARLLKGDPAGE